MNSNGFDYVAQNTRLQALIKSKAITRQLAYRVIYGELTESEAVEIHHYTLMAAEIEGLPIH